MLSPSLSSLSSPPHYPGHCWAACSGDGIKQVVNSLVFLNTANPKGKQQGENGAVWVFGCFKNRSGSRGGAMGRGCRMLVGGGAALDRSTQQLWHHPAGKVLCWRGLAETRIGWHSGMVRGQPRALLSAAKQPHRRRASVSLRYPEPNLSSQQGRQRHPWCRESLTEGCASE